MEKEQFIFPDFDCENIIEYWNCSFQEVYNQNRNLVESKHLWFVWCLEGKPFTTTLQKFYVDEGGLVQVLYIELPTDQYLFLKSMYKHDLAEITNSKIDLIKKAVKSMVEDKNTKYTFEEFEIFYKEYLNELEKEL